MVKRAIHLLLFLYLSLNIHAQEYIKTVQHYNLEKGLATRSILTSFKDSEGFMWFGTDIGAYRFDGVEFKLYQRNNTNKGPLFTGKIYEDQQKNIWFYHPKNDLQGADFSILPKGTDTLVPFTIFFKNKLPFPMEEMGFLLWDNQHNFWLRNKNSGDIFEYKDEQFVKIFNVNDSVFKEKGIESNYWSIDKDESGNNWIINGQQLFKLTPDGSIIKKDKLPALLHLGIEDGKFWFTTKEQIFVKENEDAPLTKPLFEKYNNGNAILNYRKHKGYVVEEIGEKREHFNLIDKENRKISFKGILDNVTSVLKTPGDYFFESENIFWINIYEGIIRVEFQKTPFEKTLEGVSTRWILRGENNKIWAGTNHGFIELDLIKNLPSKKIQIDFVSPQDGIKDKDGNYWFGSHQNFVNKASKNDLWNIKNYTLKTESNVAGDIYALYQNPIDSSIWAGGQRGLYLYDVVQDSFIIYKKTKNFENLEEVLIRDIKDINNGQTILVASDAGIFQIDLQKGVTDQYASENGTFPYDNLVFIHVDKIDGSLWVGTDQGGLIHRSISSGGEIVIERFTKEEGLSDNKVYAVFEDKFGFLWLPSNNGLMRFNKKTKEVTTYHKEDGIVHDEFNFFSHFEDKDGTLHFGGIQGITSFHPKEIKRAEENPTLKLTNLEVLDEEGEKLVSALEEYKDNNEITIRPSRPIFNLTASLLDFKASNANQYFYKVEGLEGRWNLMESNSFRLNGLPAGSYKVLVKAKNVDGLWSKNQLEIPLKMLRPFYLRWWFLALMALLLYVATRLFIKRRTYLLEKDKQKLEKEVARRTEQIEEDKAVIEKQAEDLKKLDELKSRFFSNVTHELRTPLTLIIGPIKQLLKSGNLDTAKARKTLAAIGQNGDQLKELVEEILDLSRLDAQKLMLNKEPVRLRNVIERWITNFEPEAENREIKFKLEYDAATNLYLNLDVQKLERIVVNLLSNAFKFSRKGDLITLKVSEEEHQMKIEVNDTGLGIHEEDLPNIFQRFYQSKQTNQVLQGGLGIGLSLCDELAKLMKGNISATSRLGFGSTFTLVFPKEKVDGIMSPRSEDNYLKPVEAKKRKDVIGIAERKNILIVEDNFQMQEFVTDLLEPIANIQIANNGKEALAILHDEKTDIELIVSDVMMPEMDGFTLLELIKIDERWQMTPFVMLTARADIQDKISALTIGVDDYIVKPFEPDELVARVQNLLTKLDLRNEPIEVEESEQSEESKKETNGEYQIGNNFEEVESANFKWLKEVEQIAVENITTSNFNVTQFAFKVHLGERQLSRKLKKLTGMTPGTYLKEVRLQTAKHLLENKAFSTVSEVSNHVGFATAEYFSRIFKKRFGKLPTEYLRNVEN